MSDALDFIVLYLPAAVGWLSLVITVIDGAIKALEEDGISDIEKPVLTGLARVKSVLGAVLAGLSWIRSKR